jgi:hypothetical protein
MDIFGILIVEGYKCLQDDPQIGTWHSVRLDITELYNRRWGALS